MSTQVIGAGRRLRISAALVALALAVAVFMLATQASSIWSTRSGSRVKPVPVNVAPAGHPVVSVPAFDHSGSYRVKLGSPLGQQTSTPRHEPNQRRRWGS